MTLGDTYMHMPRGSRDRVKTRALNGGTMSDYFRDDFQGVGAIAAARRAPRSAPAPMLGGRSSARMGCPAGCYLTRGADGAIYCDCSAAARPQRMRGIGAINDGGPGEGLPGSNGGSGGDGRTFPARTVRPARPKVPVRPPAGRPPKPPPVIPTRPTIPGTRVVQGVIVDPRLGGGIRQPLILTAIQHGNTLGGKPAPIKTQTVGGGGGVGPAWTGTSSGGGGGGGQMDMMAPFDEGEPPSEVVQSASPGGLPAGAAKIWLGLAALGVGGFFLHRHFKKRRGR